MIWIHSLQVFRVYPNEGISKLMIMSAMIRHLQTKFTEVLKRSRYSKGLYIKIENGKMGSILQCQCTDHHHHTEFWSQESWRLNLAVLSKVSHRPLFCSRQYSISSPACLPWPGGGHDLLHAASPLSGSGLATTVS